MWLATGTNGHGFGYKFDERHIGVDKDRVALFLYPKLSTRRGGWQAAIPAMEWNGVTALQKSEQNSDVTKLQGKPVVTKSLEIKDKYLFLLLFLM